MPELKRLNVPSEYNSNEILQTIPSPIKTLQDVSLNQSKSIHLNGSILSQNLAPRPSLRTSQQSRGSNIQFLDRAFTRDGKGSIGDSFLYSVEVFWAICPDPNNHGSDSISVDQFTGKSFTVKFNYYFDFREFSILIQKLRQQQGHVRSHQ